MTLLLTRGLKLVKDPTSPWFSRHSYTHTHTHVHINTHEALWWRWWWWWGTMKDEDLPGLFFFSIYFTRWRISSRFLRELSVDHLDCSVCNKILLEIQFTSDAQLCPARFYFIIIIRRVYIKVISVFLTLSKGHCFFVVVKEYNCSVTDFICLRILCVRMITIIVSYGRRVIAHDSLWQWLLQHTPSDFLHILVVIIIIMLLMIFPVIVS